MSRPRLVDLCCKAGGASVGYDRAGFDVTGVDIEPQPRYPFAFVQGDALAYLAEHGHEYDAIHASPPCQVFTQMNIRWRKRGNTKANEAVDLLTPIRAALAGVSAPWIIENVQGAARSMSASLVLHGGMFGLRVNRPRLFESNVLIPTPYGARTVDPIGVYGDHLQSTPRVVWRRSDGSVLRTARTLAEAREIMGIDWMEWRELTQAIPPPYTEWIGRHLLAAVRQRVEVAG